MDFPRAQTLRRPSLLAKEVFELERRGRYEECLNALADFWPDISQTPDITELEPRDAAEIMLRCGSAAGFWCHNKQIAGGQQVSRDLLGNARARFLDINDPEKLAECENYLSLAYWRTGELNEAEVWISEALTRDLPDSCDTRMYSHVIANLILLSRRKFETIRENFETQESVFRLFGDRFLKANLYVNYGLALKNLDNSVGALRYLEAGRDLFRKAGHKVYAAMAENNLAQLYKAERRFDAAHASIDRAAKLFKQLKDETKAGFSFDTKAQIFFAQERFEDALAAGDKAIKILRKSENAGYLIESLMTRAKALLFLDDFVSATLSLIEAHELAKVQIDEATAVNLIHEFESALVERNERKAGYTGNQDVDDDLEIVLPPALAHYDDYQGVWISTNHLETIGVKIGSLAIVVNETVKRGDPVAISEKATDAVSCGFYDSDFGIVCLEGGDLDPRLFDEDDITILGKIVGVCRGASADGRMIVEPIQN